MFRVLLVDDMKAIQDSLRNSIDWKLYNMEVAATAFNGLEAMQIVESMPIDLVITDIQMGQHGGLELCRNLAERYPHIKIIIMSGFAEFSYAQKAIKYGVLGYCLKPLEYDEICRHLVRTAQLLRSSNSQTNYDDLLDALNGNDPKTITQTLKKLGYDQPMCYLAVSTGTQRIQVEAKNGLWVRIGRRQYAYITYEPISREDAAQLLENPDTSFCASSEKINVVDLYSEINRLSIGAFQFFVEPERRLVLDAVPETGSELLSEISRVISVGDRGQLIACLEKARNNSGEFTAHCALRLYHLITVNKLFLQGEYEDIFHVEQLVRKYGSFSRMLDDLIQHLEYTGSETEENSLSNTRFLQMMAYINEHYTQDISLTQMGEELHLNNNYLSQIFKRETGITFSKYIVNLRIEKAKELLATGNYSIGKTAQEVGFNDYFYFLKTFKRITGMTPRQYCMGDIPD